MAEGWRRQILVAAATWAFAAATSIRAAAHRHPGLPHIRPGSPHHHPRPPHIRPGSPHRHRARLTSDPACHTSAPTCLIATLVCLTSDPTCLTSDPTRHTSSPARLIATLARLTSGPTRLIVTLACLTSDPTCLTSGPTRLASTPACLTSNPTRLIATPACLTSAPACLTSAPTCLTSIPACLASDSACLASDSARLASTPAYLASTPTRHASDPTRLASSPTRHTPPPRGPSLVPSRPMDVVSHCPLPVAGRLWRPRAGAFAYTFVCKATFTLAPGKLALAAEQQPLHEVDRPWSDTVTSLYAAADLAPRKLRADVVLIGNAYAPGGVPVRKLVARLAVGEVDKSIEVWCDRTLRADGSLVNGPAFDNLPLLYERAAGGPGTDNPVGMAPDRDAYGSVALPNLTPPGARVGLDVVIPATGFGPIAARWPSRLARLGRTADELLPSAWQDKPLPPDLDMAYFNVAPADQQPPTLLGDEPIVLENLHPAHPQLSMVLPGLRVSVKVNGPGGEKPGQVRCDTLWIDTSREICCLTYRGQVLVGNPSEAGWVVVTLDEDASDEPPTDRGRPRNLTGTVGIEEPDRPKPLTQRPRALTALFVAAPDATSPKAPRPLAATGLPFQAVQPGREPPPPPRRSDPGSALPFRTDGAPPPALPLGPPVVLAPPLPPLLPPLPLPLPQRAAAAALPHVPAPTFDGGAPPSPPAQTVPQTVAPPPLTKPPPSDSPWALPPIVPGAGTIAPLAPPPAAASLPAPGDFRTGGGTLLASNAAAGVADARPARTLDRPLPLPSPVLRAVPAPARDRNDAVDLLFFNPEALPRMRRVPSWKTLIAALEDRPLDPEDDDPSAVEDPVEIEDRREVLEILLRADPSDAAAIDEALGRAVRDDGRFVAPLFLLAGELSTPFDEIESPRPWSPPSPPSPATTRASARPSRSRKTS